MTQKDSLKLNKYLLYINATEKIAVISIYDKSGVEYKKAEIIGGQLSETLLVSIKDLGEDVGILLQDVSAVGVHPGPGSYTGLRIGLTTANLLAFTLNIPIFSANENNLLEEWERVDSFFSNPILPFYANAPHITTPKPRLR